MHIHPLRLLQPPSLFHWYFILPRVSGFCAGRTITLCSFRAFILNFNLIRPSSPNVGRKPDLSYTGGKIQPEDSSGDLALSTRERHVWLMGYPHRQVELTGIIGLSCISSMYTSGWLITSSITFLPQWDWRSMFGWQLWVENQPECWGTWRLVPDKLVSLSKLSHFYRLLSLNPSIVPDIAGDAFFVLQMNDASGAVLSSPIFKFSCSSPCLFISYFNDVDCYRCIDQRSPFILEFGLVRQLSQMLHWIPLHPISLHLWPDSLSFWFSYACYSWHLRFCGYIAVMEKRRKCILGDWEYRKHPHLLSSKKSTLGMGHLFRFPYSCPLIHFELLLVNRWGNFSFLNRLTERMG